MKIVQVCYIEERGGRGCDCCIGKSLAKSQVKGEHHQEVFINVVVMTIYLIRCV